MFFFQLIIILAFARLLHWPMKRIGLPIVIGEMLAGFLLGPTFFGTFFPLGFGSLFPEENIHQIGELAAWILALYYFVIGLQLNTPRLSDRPAALASTALVSGLLPAVTGFLIAGAISPSSSTAFKLSVALCFSVTAFPVLMRIVEEAGMLDRPVGLFSIGTSALLEVILWCCLPVMVVFYKTGNLAQAMFTVAWVAGFLLLWLTVVRYLLQRLWTKLPHGSLYAFLLFAGVGIASACITKSVGIPGSFGALIGGLIVPRQASFPLAKKIKPFCLFLLPVFFASAGLKTTLHLQGGSDLLTLSALALLAYAVKWLGTAVLARTAGGFDWSESATIGHLMGAKGAAGFAIIGTCLTAGLLDPQGYSVLAFIVLVNTIMAAWGATLQQRFRGKKDPKGSLVDRFPGWPGPILKRKTLGTPSRLQRP